MNNFMKELKVAHDVGDNVYYIGTGIGLNFTLIKLNSQFQKLNIKKCIDDYKMAKRKLILLDYEVKFSDPLGYSSYKYYWNRLLL